MNTLVEDPVTLAVLERLVSRHKQGMVEYGTSLADNPKDTIFWIESAIEEALDLAQYLERLKQEIVQKQSQSELQV